jgi:hypothetical protein
VTAMNDEELTDEQQSRVAAVMAALDSRPTPNLIDISARLRLPDAPDDATKKRFRAAYAGAIAAEKIQYYLPHLRAANEQRVAIGKRIFELNRRAREVALTDPFGSVEPEIEANGLAGQQEVPLHVYAVCIRVIFKLLPFAARAAGYKMPSRDLDTLKTFEPLRHFYEHLWEQLPGGGGDYVDEVVDETDDERGWRIVWGLPTDGLGNILLGGQTIDVSSDSVSAVQDVVERTWAKLRESAQAHAEKYLRANPDRIPHPRQIPSGISSSPGGTLAGLEPFRPWDLEESAWVLNGGGLAPNLGQRHG